ncbi:MAG: carbohydrate kinase family protein [Anaerolineaceae bacterium]|nr:MAG: carbohydrate kinase family protein [Anaerolineaceae bacterium]
MEPSFILVGQLARDYLLPPLGQPLLDSPGGNLLYAAGGLGLWDSRIGLVSRAGENYPRQWLKDLKKRGWDTSGIRIQPGALDQRNFLAYSENLEPIRSTPVSHFGRRGVPFPKSLLGYQPHTELKPSRKPDQASPIFADIPSDYIDAGALHLCPLELSAHQQFADNLRGAIRILTLDPSAAAMTPSSLREMRGLVHGLTAFLPSLEEITALFWGETSDPWEMATAIGEFGCEYVILKCGERGQLLYDSHSKHRWEIPAYPARLADPTGAGDAFCGGFLAGYRKNYDALEGVLYGNVSASLAIEGSGPYHPLEAMQGLAEARLEALREMVRKI